MWWCLRGILALGKSMQDDQKVKVFLLSSVGNLRLLQTTWDPDSKTQRKKTKHESSAKNPSSEEIWGG